MVYPHRWSPVSCRSSAGQGKFAGQRPTLYRCATRPTTHHLCSFDSFQILLNPFSIETDTACSSKLFQKLTILSVKKCCRISLKAFLFQFISMTSSKPTGASQCRTQKRIQVLQWLRPLIILYTSIKSERIRLSSKVHKFKL